MSFLKKLGVFLAKGAKIGAQLAGILPMVQPMLGSAGPQIVKGVNDFSQIAAMISLIEVAMQGKPGNEKFAAVIPLIRNIVLTSEAVSGKKIQNDLLFTKGVEEVAQGMVDILNAVHPDEVKP
jgi:DNA mismatch repair protein MutH